MPQTKLSHFTVHYSYGPEFHQVKKDIWSDHAYYFETANPEPIIIDAGAHIGLATLYWKKYYPQAQITAIEPNPHSRALLEQNIWENDLSEVTVIDRALSDQDKPITFFFPSNPTDWQLNSGLQPNAWNGQLEKTMDVHKVETIRLSSLLNQPIDLLKLDIEGAEQAVLLEGVDHLHNVKHLIMEFHPTASQSLDIITKTLKKAGFSEITYQQHNQIVDTPNLKQLVLIEAKRSDD